MRFGSPYQIFCDFIRKLFTSVWETCGSRRVPAAALVSLLEVNSVKKLKAISLRWFLLSYDVSVCCWLSAGLGLDLQKSWARMLRAGSHAALFTHFQGAVVRNV